MNDEGVIRTTEIDQKQARKFLKIGIDFIGKNWLEQKSDEIECNIWLDIAEKALKRSFS